MLGGGSLLLGETSSLGGNSDSESGGELVTEGESDGVVRSSSAGLEGGLGVVGMRDGEGEGGGLGGVLGVQSDLNARLSDVTSVVEGSTSGGSGGLLVVDEEGEGGVGDISELNGITIELELLVGLSSRREGRQNLGSSADGLVGQSNGGDEGELGGRVSDGLLKGDLTTLVQDGQLVGVDLSGLGDLALRDESSLQARDLRGLIGSLERVDGGSLGGLSGSLKGNSLGGEGLSGLQQGRQGVSGVGGSDAELLHSTKTSIESAPTIFHPFPSTSAITSMQSHRKAHTQYRSSPKCHSKSHRQSPSGAKSMPNE